MPTPPRPLVHPDTAAVQDAYHDDLVQAVAAAVAANAVVVVGVAGLQPGKQARKLLDAQGIAHKYLEYGSYFSGWKRRLALKIWAGWPTFPLVFVKGRFIGGASDLERFQKSGELARMLAD